MKFAHVLYLASNEVPEYRTLYVFYKGMKKSLKRFMPRGAAGEVAPPPAGGESTSEPESRFVTQLVSQLVLLNTFRLTRQEACSIKLLGLLAHADAVRTEAERRDIYQRLVDFHGEALLLLHWGILAFTAIVKLLKKHHKHMGHLIQSPQLQAILRQSWSGEELHSMIGRAEAAIQQIQDLTLAPDAPMVGPPVPPPSAPAPSALSNSNGVLLAEASWLSLVASIDVDKPPTVEEESDDWALEDDGDGTDGTSVKSSHGSNCVRDCILTALHASQRPAATESSTHHNDRQDVGHAITSTSGEAGTASRPVGSSLSSHAPPFTGDREQHAHNLNQQMQMALSTWELLQRSAATPSTVWMPGLAARNRPADGMVDMA